MHFSYILTQIKCLFHSYIKIIIIFIPFLILKIKCISKCLKFPAISFFNIHIAVQKTRQKSDLKKKKNYRMTEIMLKIKMLIFLKSSENV